MEDFKFIEEDMDEENIKTMSKQEYKQKIKVLVRKASFKVLNEEKQGHKKAKNIVYDFVIQPYLTQHYLIMKKETCYMLSGQTAIKQKTISA